ncbi:peptidoglycan/LPS O-acetylase OafA/YrhL [Saccharothrix ecbatanensis]|uniref:Peptidoglycan/LPS O-acetylase OafA/YrhL n=1 Tax=Saccharothrix ecbatanensis TaxID=1105145 RepID=A0A7W9HUH1_9PSEU|nr:acyltransferase family protein [Saccharothrix ecbatanensis]MBB5808371.1 peptidoglycan/LPS O-acetylase OafA/YrhL [Saccharothrix ecbatanensis]
MTAPSARRHDLDVLRIGAFLLLIAFHLGMFYVPSDWHVKSTHVTPALEPWMDALSPWRLSLLFVISGVATRFMADKLAAGALAAQRTRRLLIPLLCGIGFVVAPQSWAEVVEKNGYTGSFLDFWPRYLMFDQSFGIVLPTYNHLWFVAYLWSYTMIVLAAAPLLPRADHWAGRVLGGAGLFVVPVLLFGLYRATAYRAWGETHVLWADGYAHLQYGTAFLLGFLLARQDAAWALLEKARAGMLAAAVVLAVAGLTLARLGVDDLPGWPGAGCAFLREAYAWAVICTLFGYARRYVRGGSPLLSTLNEAVFPFYIVHQTAIVLAGHLLKPLELHVAAEVGIILAVTVASGAAAYHLARTVPALREPLGLKPHTRRARQVSTAEKSG